MSATISLGKLEKVDLRTVWKNESGDFTPWLAREENLSVLSDTIGIDLELQAQEQSVGPYSADILCKDTATDEKQASAASLETGSSNCRRNKSAYRLRTREWK